MTNLNNNNLITTGPSSTRAGPWIILPSIYSRNGSDRDGMRMVRVTSRHLLLAGHRTMINFGHFLIVLVCWPVSQSIECGSYCGPESTDRICLEEINDGQFVIHLSPRLE